MIVGPKAKNLTVVGRFAYSCLHLRQQLQQSVVLATTTTMVWNNKFFRRQHNELIALPSRKQQAKIRPNITGNGEYVSVSVCALPAHEDLLFPSK